MGRYVCHNGLLTRGAASVFLSSSTDPFVPQERRLGVTRRVLDALIAHPPDALIVQIHAPVVADELARLVDLSQRCALRVHVSIETDRDALPGPLPPASSVGRRMDAAAALERAGIRTAVTVMPLLPIDAPELFFARLSEIADAVVIDNYIEEDGAADGAHTARTAPPAAMEALTPGSTRLDYRDEMVAIARAILPGGVGVGREGFAGRGLL